MPQMSRPLARVFVDSFREVALMGGVLTLLMALLWAAGLTSGHSLAYYVVMIAIMSLPYGLLRPGSLRSFALVAVVIIVSNFSLALALLPSLAVIACKAGRRLAMRSHTDRSRRRRGPGAVVALVVDSDE